MEEMTLTGCLAAAAATAAALIPALGYILTIQKPPVEMSQHPQYY